MLKSVPFAFLTLPPVLGLSRRGSSRQRERFEAQLASGATVSRQQWLNRTVLGLNGIEIQRFSAFLAELNLLIQSQ